MKTTRDLSDREFGIAADHDQLPELTVSQGQLNEAQQKLPLIWSLADSEDWDRLLDDFYRQRIVYVRSNNVLLLRFEYDYEIDLDELKTARDLLSWALHLCEKTWMTTERLHHFIEAVSELKGFKVHGL